MKPEKRIRLTHIDYEVDLRCWTLAALEEFNFGDVVRKAVEEALEYALEDDATYIYFPVEYEPLDSRFRIEQPVDDPLTIYLRIGLESEAGEKPTYAFNLRACLEDSMKDCAADGSSVLGLERLSRSMRGLVDDIDKAIALGKQAEAKQSKEDTNDNG